MGHVEDLASIFERVRLTVAPLRFGSGVKGKVLASLAAGVPCVMTPVAAEGIALPPELADWTGHSASEIAHRIVSRHADRTACRRAVSHDGPMDRRLAATG